MKTNTKILLVLIDSTSWIKLELMEKWFISIIILSNLFRLKYNKQFIERKDKKKLKDLKKIVECGENDKTDWYS